MSDKIIHFFTPEEQAERMLRNPKKVDYTEEDQYIDNYYRGVAQTRRESREALEAKQQEEEIPVDTELFPEAAPEQLTQEQEEEREYKQIQQFAMMKEAAIVDTFCLQRDMDAFKQVFPWNPVPILDCYPNNPKTLVKERIAAKKRGERPPMETEEERKLRGQAYQESRKIFREIMEEEREQMSREARYLTGVSQNAADPAPQFFLPSTCKIFFNYSIRYADEYRDAVRTRTFTTPEASQELDRNLMYYRGMAQSWYKQARAYEEAVFHTFTMLQTKNKTSSYDPRDFEAMMNARGLAETRLWEEFRIHWKDLMP